MRSGLRLPWHPLLFAAWPVLFVFSRNVTQTPPREGVSALALVLACTAVLLVAATLALRDVRRAGLLVTVVVLGVLMWGHARNLLSDPAWLLPAWLAAVAVLAVLAARARRIVDELTTILTGTAVILVALSLVPLVRAYAPMVLSSRSAGAAVEPLEERVGEWSGPGQPRDIYYLVFDRYGSTDSLRDVFGFDNSYFTDRLEQRGFYVAHDSRANLLRTASSLASSLNLRYLDDLAERYGPDTGNMLPVYEMLQDHAVGRILRDRGYEYVHIGAWWDPTQDNRHADVNLGYGRRSDFFNALRGTTVFAEWGRPPARKFAEKGRRDHYEGGLDQFRQIRAAAARPGPTFTFAHVLLPHEPFVFDREGRYLTLAEDAQRGRTRNFTEQLEYTNKLIDDLLDDLLDVPEEQRPIIVVTADEGPHPVRFKAGEAGFDWTKATDAELGEKFRILNAFLLPGVEDPPLYPSISPVNNWRMLFNTYFGADLPLLEDRSFIWRNESHVYDYTEVTDRIP